MTCKTYHSWPQQRLLTLTLALSLQFTAQANEIVPYTTHSIQQQTDLKRSYQEDSDSGLLVSLAEYAIKQYDPESSITALKTFGIGPCIAVSLYHPDTQTGILMHVDALTHFTKSMRTIDLRLQELQIPSFSKNPSEWEVTLIGGNTFTKTNILKIHKTLRTYRLNRIQQNILTRQIENAWLDLKTGQIYKFKIKAALSSNKIRMILPFMTFGSLKRAPKSD